MEIFDEIQICYDFNEDDQPQEITTQNKVKDTNFEDINLQIEESIKNKETFDMFIIDPPWDYNCKESKIHNGNVPYPVMNDDELSKIKLQQISNRDSFMLLWTTSPKLESAFLFMHKMNYLFVTVFLVWKKIRKNSTKSSNVVGNYTLGTVEFLLLCKNHKSKSVRKFVKYQKKIVVRNLVENYTETKGSDFEIIKNIREDSKKLLSKELEDMYYNQIFASAEVQEHSKKPKFIYDIIFQMFYLTTSAELFARQKNENFKSYGNEIDKFKSYLYDEKKAIEIKKIQEYNHKILEKYNSFKETTTNLIVGKNSKILEVKNDSKITTNYVDSIINENYTLTQMKDQKIIKFKKIDFKDFENYKKNPTIKKKRKKEIDLKKKEKKLKVLKEKLKKKEKELKLLEETLKLKEKEISQKIDNKNKETKGSYIILKKLK